TALVISGLPTDRFVYLGYLPRRSGERRRYLESLSGETRTVVCLEAPHRLLAALADMKDVLGDRRVAACRELTKLHEEVFRGRLGQAIEHFGKPRGEFTLVVEGAAGLAAKDSAGAESLLKGYHAQGLGAKQSVARVAAETGLPKKEVYRMWLKALSSY
ncbi:MAG: 16S rRNA (cytidine(1402)-2'-O)-methyltransferase, partial [Chloroflexi bacterium]|nr:16S rRNA (cytidine(1402)-2'-O)-methyltransferase [Chloroflexota bacterium]